MGKSVPSASSKNEAFSVQDLADDVIVLVEVRFRGSSLEISTYTSFVKHVGWKEIDILGFSVVSPLNGSHRMLHR